MSQVVSVPIVIFDQALDALKALHWEKTANSLSYGVDSHCNEEAELLALIENLTHLSQPEKITEETTLAVPERDAVAYEALYLLRDFSPLIQHQANQNRIRLHGDVSEDKIKEMLSRMTALLLDEHGAEPQQVKTMTSKTVTLFECTSCGYLYQSQVSRCDCMPDVQTFNHWVAMPREEYELLQAGDAPLLDDKTDEQP